MTTTLHDYTDVEPLVVRELQAVRSPIGGEVLGFIGPSNRDANCIVSQQTYAADNDGQQQYYRKLGGYSFNEVDLETIQGSGAERIVIHELDRDRLYEFELSQYLNGEDGGYVNDRQKIGVPLSDALYEWPLAEAEIIRNHTW